MPTLEWIGKSKVINHHQEVPFRVLEEKYTYNNSASENKIIHGDNLEALKALLPEYEGRINCIYIDPPYNTGKEGWVYNDNVNDPKIKKWLGEVVGKEGNDLSRHDKWLCMMYPRLRLLHQLLAEEGVIFISIDDNEVYNLKLLCDEIFGSKNYVDRLTIIVKTEGRRYGAFAKTHENMLIYAKNSDLLDLNEIEVEGKKYKYEDEQGGFNLKGLRNRNVRAFNSTNRPNLRYPFYVQIDSPDSNGLCKVNVEPIDGYVEVWAQTIDGLESVWRWGKENVVNRLDELCAYRGKDGNIRIYQKERKLTETAKTVWIDKEFTSIFGTKEMISVFGTAKFNFPKPSKLIQRVIEISTTGESLILDSFAGSGTTAHAVLNMNKADGGKRKFILIEMEEYADSITAERVKRVIDGYQYQKETTKNLYNKKITLTDLKKGVEKLIKKAEDKAESEAGNYDKISGPDFVEGYLRVTGTKFASENIEGTGGDFTYYELGEPLLKKDGTLNEEVPVEKIQHYIWHTETHTPYNKPENENPAYLGEYNHTAYYFHYKKDELTTLDYNFLAGVNIKADNYVIYADTCILSQEELLAYNITFKKIPRDITKI